MRAFRWTIALTAIAFFVGATPAVAETFPVQSPFAGPALDGSRLWWMDAATYPGDPNVPSSLRLEYADPGAQPRLAWTTPPAMHRVEDFDSIAASGGRVALVDDGNLYLGGAGGLQRIPLDQAPGNTERCFTTSTDLDGTTLVYTEFNCGLHEAVFVRDLTGRRPTIRVPGSDNIEFRAPLLLVAGNYVAWDTTSQPNSGTGSKIIVYDWAAGTQAYAVDLDSLVGAAAFTSSIRFALQPDGKLAVAFSSTYNRGPEGLAWFSPQDPTAHVLPVQVHADTNFVNRPLAMAHDLIFARRADYDLIVTTLDGKVVDDIPAPDGNPHYFGNLAFNGSYLAWEAGFGTGNGLMMCAGPFPGVPDCNNRIRDLGVSTSGPAVTLRLALASPARLRVAIDRCRRGIKHHRCLAPHRVASAERHARKGRNRIRLRNAARARGSYRARVSIVGRHAGSPVELLFRNR